jgi:hypothetical protein
MEWLLRRGAGGVGVVRESGKFATVKTFDFF